MHSQALFPRSRATLVTLTALLTLSFSAQAATVTGSLGIDPNSLSGTDNNGRVQLFSPNPFQGGSSVSHWDRSATPNLLMEPSISSNIGFGQVDLARPLMQDIGWNTGSSNIVLQVEDGPGEGFNDPALGAQRMQAMQRAADIWASVLRSNVTINVGIRFDNMLACSVSGGATLATAGPRLVFDDFGGGVANTWYAGPLAEALTGQNLSAQNDNGPDIRARFNPKVDQQCLGPGSGFYYGLNGNEPPGQVNFVTTALHELGHGLGFASFADGSNGTWFMNQPDIFSRFLRDNGLGLNWDQMTNAQRAGSAVNTNQLVWSGTRVTNQAPNFLNPGPALVINSPASASGRYAVTEAEFGPAIGSPTVSGEIVAAVPALACGALTNGGQVAGKIALVDRGTCNFTVKVKNAQNAGARAVVVANNVAGNPIVMGGTDNTINIPSAMISRSNGNRIKNALGSQPPPDDPGTLQLASNQFDVSEGDGTATINVVRNGGTSGAVSVNFATSDGTATAGSDYTTTNGTANFADGESGPVAISVPIAEDGNSEDDEFFTVTLSNPTGDATLGSPSSARVNILDNEPCIASATVACLENQRFKIRVTWENFDEDIGDGTLVPSTADDSALFWFFDQENWEMLVKIVNGCGFNNHFWVFSAATTNVQYTLRVTDTQSGVTKEYENPLGNAADAITDTSAFATCP